MSAPVSRRSRPAKAPLSREVIVRTGLEVLDRDGLDALTMRRVGLELDTGAASLYVYVRNREDLLEAMLEAALADVPLPDEGPWRQQIKELVASATEAMSRHEGLALVALGAIPTGEHALRILDRLLALLKDGGLDDVTAAWAVDLLYLHITAGAAEQGAYNTNDRTQEQHLADADRVYAALPADRYPMLTALRGPLLSAGDREHWGVQVLLNGILNTPAGGFSR